jgi:hypothetical protein
MKFFALRNATSVFGHRRNRGISKRVLTARYVRYASR